MRIQSIFWFLLLGVASDPLNMMAQAPGTFTATGSMTTPRMGHTATLLPNGKVLITGGWQSVPGSQNCTGQLHVRAYFLECVILLTSAELYDPSTGTFAATGNMATAHLFHTATLLPDGRVLIHWETGDYELYDSSTGTFSRIDNMTTGGRTATVLGNGKVLFTGLPAEIYDPSAGTFVATGAYAGTAGSLVTATLLPDGRVLLAWDGGAAEEVGRTELYDPATGTFSLTAPIFVGSSLSFTATLLTTGKVLVAGGVGVGSYLITAGVYDPSMGTFTATGNMTTARQDQTATLLPDGTVLIAGGDFAAGTSAELYNLGGGTFASAGTMATPRFLHTATLLPDGRVLLAGGLPYSTATTSSAELYAPPSLLAGPALFSLSGDGRGQGAIWQALTGLIASPSSPAIAGDILSLYTTSLVNGGVIPPQVAIGGRLAEILFFGAAPGYPGYNQINFRVPSGIAPGPAVPVRLNYLGRSSNEVTIGVR